MKTRNLIPAILVSALLISPSFAENQTAGTGLAPGKPAGVHAADLSTSTLLAIGVLAVIAGGAIIIVNNEGTSKSTAATTP